MMDTQLMMKFDNLMQQLTIDDLIYLNKMVVKNEELKRKRGISFEEIAFHIENDGIIDVFEHPNQDTYPGQKIYAVRIDDYIYLTPFVEEKEYLFLKTIIPSRKATKNYLSGGKSYE